MLARSLASTRTALLSGARCKTIMQCSFISLTADCELLNNLTCIGGHLTCLLAQDQIILHIMENQECSAAHKLTTTTSASPPSEISTSKRYQQRASKSHAVDNNSNKQQTAGNQQEDRAAPALLNQGKENHTTTTNQINSSDQPEQKFCFECNRSLAKSRHLINIAGQMHKWHPECFRCHVCNNLLEREISCHVYKDKIFCRNDYAKLQRDNSTKCARCRWPIAASDWVRKAGKYVYHLACFTCDICLRQLSTGEQFTINIQEKELIRLLCRLHFAVNQSSYQQLEHVHHLAGDSDNMGAVLSETTGSGLMGSRLANSSPNNSITHSISQSFDSTAVYCGGKQLKGFQPEGGGFNRDQYLHLLAAASCAPNGGGPTDCVQKQQARSEFDFSGSSLTSCQLQMDNDGLMNSSQHQQVQARRPGPVSSTSSSNSSPTTRRLIGVDPNGVGGHTSKSKRVRTTFTEDQLAILQTHFQIDSNPDGQDLERIATITGLSKRVTQVWFQNSRARQKKYMIKRKPGASSSSLVNQSQAAGVHGPVASGSVATNHQPPGNHLFAQSSHNQAGAPINKDNNYQSGANLSSDRSELSLDEQAALDCLAEDDDGSSSIISNDGQRDDEDGITVSEEEDDDDDDDEEGAC